MKKNNLPDVVTFSQDDMKRFEDATFIIKDCQEKSEGLAETIAGQLFVVAKKELFKIDDYKTVHEWAMEEFDISKGTVSDAINTFERFGDGTTGRIKAEYSDFMFSTLIRMKSLTDEQIETAGIVPTMSRKQVTDAIKALKVLEDKQKDLPRIEKEWADLYKTLSEHLSFDARVSFLTSILPDFYEEGRQLTVIEYEKLIEAVKAYIELSDKATEASKQFAEDEWVNNVLPFVCSYTKLEPEFVEDGDCTMEQLEAILEAINEYNSSAVEQEQEEEVEQEQEEEVEQEEEQEEEQEPPHSYPQYILRLENFRRDNGTIDKKAFLQSVWEAVQGVENNEQDVLITK